MGFLIKKMKDYINSDDSDFKKFKLNYTDQEIIQIKKFNISKSKSYDYMGNKNDMKNINTFLNNIGTNDKACINILEKIIIKILDNVLSAFHTDYYWISISVTLPNNEFDIPRWHKDGKFFLNSKTTKSPHFITVLKGPGTLLIKGTQKVNKIYNDLLLKIDDEYNKLKTKSGNKYVKITNKYRPIFADALKSIKIIQPKNNEGIIIHPEITKGINEGALHSEPKMDTPRLFISILPGSKIDIEELNKRY